MTSHSSLHEQSRSGCVDGVRQLLERGMFNINCTDSMGRTALHIASYEGHVGIVRLLTELGADTAIRDNEGCTALTLAAKAGHDTVINVVLSSGECTVNSRDNNGWTALHHACAGGNLAAVKCLCKHSNADVNALTHDGDTPLIIAALHRKKDVALCLIRKFGSNPNSKGKFGKTVMHIACRMGSIELVKALIKHKAQPNTLDHFRNPPILEAALSGHDNIVLCMIHKFGCDPHTKGWKGRSLLHNACQAGKDRLVRTLVKEYKANIHAVDHDGVAPIHVAAWKGHTKVIHCLIEFKFDPNMKGGIGRSLLHHACQGGNVHLVKTLIVNHKADVNLLDHEKDTPIHVAAGKGHVDVVRCLIKEFGCDPNTKGKNGSSLLHRACQGANENLVQMLINDYQADVNFLNLRMEAPIHVAARNGEVSIVECLTDKFGCNPSMRGHLGRSVLHEACQSGNISLVRILLEKYKVDVNAQDDKKRTPVFVALANNHLEIVSYLIKEFHCDRGVADIFGNASSAQPLIDALPVVVKVHDSGGSLPQENLHEDLCFINKFGDDFLSRTRLGISLLQCACRANNVALVSALLEQSLSPILADESGNTPLHTASCFNHVRCVEVLLNANAPVLVKNFNGFTPFDVATGEAKIVLECYLATHHEKDRHEIYLEHVRQKYPNRIAIMRVFIIGNPAAGKSSLIESLRRSFNGLIERVSEASVPPHTAGIIPSVHMDSQCGRVCFYDFAGNSEYFSSHAAFLEKFSNLTTGHDVFIITVDLRKDNDALKSTLHYWVMFIQHQDFSRLTPISFIVVGSHADLISDEQVKIKLKFVQQLCEEFKCNLATEQMPCFVLNCCDSNTYQFGDLKSQIMSLKRLSPAYPLFSDLCLLLGMLETDFSEVTACSIRTIVSHIRDTKVCLPTEMRRLFPIFSALHGGGMVLLLNNPPSDNYHVVLNCSKLTAEVHKLLFSKASIEEIRKKAQNDLGIIPNNVIKKILPPYVTEECLIQLQFCQKIDYKDVNVFTSFSNSSCPESSHFLFFPALCTAEKPKEKPLHRFNYAIRCIMHCPEAHDYFPPRFLHVLILRLVFKFTLSVPSEIQPSGSSEEQIYFQRRCTMWMKGVCWLMTCGVQCMVELVDESKGVVVITESDEDRMENCVSVFTEIVASVFEAKDSFCHSIMPRYFLLDSSDENDYLDPDHQFAMSDVEKALMEGTEAIVSASGKAMMDRKCLGCMSKLTYWDLLFPMDFNSVLKYLCDIVELHELVINLDISFGILKTLEANFPRDCEKRKKELVRHWMSSSSADPPCWWQLIEALKAMNKNVLAESIERNHSELI